MALKPWWRETLETVLWAVLLALIIRAAVVQAFWIPSGSMIPTLLPKDRVLVCKFWYAIREPKRGQIFVFKYPVDPKRDFVKRIIGLPGDSLSIRQGQVFINGEAIDEPYVVFRDSYNMQEVKVPEGHYFAMGDNRPNSQDSRFWGFVPKKNIRGPVFFRYWPIKRMGKADI